VRYFPAFLDLAGRRALVVGGGAAAARKVRLLLRAGAEVLLVAPALDAELAGRAAAGQVRWRRRRFRARHLAGAALVIVASEDADETAAAAGAARAAGVPVNVVDQPALSSFIMPAIVARDPVVIGICSGGASPVLARRLRAAIEAVLPERIGALGRFAASFRAAVAAKVPGGRARRRFWEAVFDGPIGAAVLRGEDSAAREAMLALVNGPEAARAGLGVEGAGAGAVRVIGDPGDPELLTLGALRAIQEADLLVAEPGVDAALLERARRDAARRDAGRDAAETAAIVAAHARHGARVVWLTEDAGGAALGALRACGAACAMPTGAGAAASEGLGRIAAVRSARLDLRQAQDEGSGTARRGDAA